MEIVLLPMSVIAIITGLSQLAKSFGLRSQLAGALSVILGVTFALGLDGVTFLSGLNGLASGLTAIGLYEIGGGLVMNKLSGK